MRNWGILITIFYAMIVIGLLVPGYAFIAGMKPPWEDTLRVLYSEWLVWFWVVLVVSGQAILLFLSVDTTRQRISPRTHIGISYITGAALMALLTFAAIWSGAAGVLGDNIFDDEGNLLLLDTRAKPLIYWGVLWAAWSIIFFGYLKDSPKPLARVIAWLLRGSVLELLIAVSCHVIVRHRDDCSAPIATSFGIVTGIAVMLLSFGPSVLFLYKKRLDKFRSPYPD